jgi:hypothetical protein
MQQTNFLNSKLKPCKLKRECPCGSKSGYITQTETIHAGKVRCLECDRFLKWLSREDMSRAVTLNLVNEGIE